MVDGLISRRLSGKLLLMTIGFVMLAELLLFIPSATVFRQDYIEERAERAGHLALALMGVPDYEGSEILSQKFMSDTDVIMVSSKHDGMSELILGMPPHDGEFDVVDLRVERRLPGFRYAFGSFFGSDQGYLRVLANPVIDTHDVIEIILPKSSLKEEMRAYFGRVFWLSLLIAIVTGGMIYFALSAMIVRPIKHLADGLAAFREDPEKRRAALLPSSRRDEIGRLEREFYDMKQSVRASFQQRERLASLGMAVAKINHDLRNVLTSAQLVSDRIAMDKDERVAVMGERLVRAVDRGIRLCSDVLSYSKGTTDPVEIETIRIALLVGEVAGDTLGQFRRNDKPIEFINKIPSELAVRADPDDVYRIIHNLFRNSGQAIQGRFVGVDDVEPPARIIVTTSTEGGEVRLSVMDTGPGLPKKALDNLFQAFTGGTSHDSSGLGLTISRDLARDQDGELSLAHTGADGTEFILTLKAA
ncbi:MAG: sensor histidine kinase [Maricaulaceae bacterium]